jgi:pimeloyl-ACP methyl ester carboxylesterase
MTSIKSIIYAHGLGGSPESAKALLIRSFFEPRGIKVESPSLALPSLERLSPLAVRDYMADRVRALSDECVAVVGSSFGAYVALHALAHVPEVRPHCLVLLAPVIDPWDSRSALLSSEVERGWKEKGFRPIVDLARGVEVPVHYEFVEELRCLGSGVPRADIPTLLVHGERDPIVSIERSREFASAHSTVTFKSLDDDHALLGDPQAWLRLVEDFIAAPRGGRAALGEL